VRRAPARRWPAGSIGGCKKLCRSHRPNEAYAGTGSFEGTASVLTFALTVPTFVMWIPETIPTLAFLARLMTPERWLDLGTRPGLWSVFAVGYQLIALGWYAVLVTSSVWASQIGSGHGGALFDEVALKLSRDSRMSNSRWPIAPPVLVARPRSCTAFNR
jgi:hypothetical protein